MDDIEEMKPYVGIEIGGTKLQWVAGHPSTGITARGRASVDHLRGADGIRSILESRLPAFARDARASAIAVGFGGPVDRATGSICCSHQIEGWSGFKLKDWLQSLTGLPVVAENDANTATLGEALHGAGRGFNPVFYVTLGSGVGGGLVVDQLIYHGARPGEAEIGHVRLHRDGATVESRCSGWAVDLRIREAAAAAPGGLLARLTRGASGGEARVLPEALAKKDPEAARILSEVAEDLAFGLSHVVHLFHPEVIVLGGGLSLVGEPLRAAVQDALPPFTMSAFAPGPQVRLAALGEDAVPIGALELARRLDA